MAQTSPNTPLSRVRAAFADKKDLIEKVKGLATDDLWTDRLSTRAWKGLSNTQLLHLHAVLTEAKSKFGSRAKLIDAVIAAHGRSKDEDYKKHFEGWSVPRLLDAVKSAEHRTKLATAKTKKKAAAAAKKPAPTAKKGVAKKGVAKKGAAEKKPAAAAAKKPAAKKTAKK